VARGGASADYAPVWCRVPFDHAGEEGGERGGLERLRDESCEPEPPGARSVGGVGLSAEEDDRDVARPFVTAERFGQGETVETRDPNVRQDQVRWLEPRLLEATPAVGGLHHLESLQAEVQRAHPPRGSVTIDKEHAWTTDARPDPDVVDLRRGMVAGRERVHLFLLDERDIAALDAQADELP
jgi:hypothetical protein